jgi:hypothetical protein
MAYVHLYDERYEYSFVKMTWVRITVMESHMLDQVAREWLSEEVESEQTAE